MKVSCQLENPDYQPKVNTQTWTPTPTHEYMCVCVVKIMEFCRMCVLCVTCCIAFQVVKLQAAIKFSEEDYPNAKVCVYVCVCMYMCVCVCVCVCGYLRDEALLHVTFSSSSLFLVAGRRCVHQVILTVSTTWAVFCTRWRWVVMVIIVSDSNGKVMLYEWWSSEWVSEWVSRWISEWVGEWC